MTSIESLNRSYLNHVVQTAGFDAHIRGFRRERIAGESHGGGALHRFHLDVLEDHNHNVPKSIILKQTNDRINPAFDPGYAGREFHCYHNDVFRSYGTSELMPTIYLLDRPSRGHYWIWMEDLSAAFSAVWTQQSLADSLRAITRLYAIWWNRIHELTPMLFLQRRAQSMYDGIWKSRIAANSLMIEQHPHGPEIGRVFTHGRCQLLSWLSDASTIIYRHLDRLPQALLHQDLWLANIACSQNRTTLIDWSHTGTGSPGSEFSYTFLMLTQMWEGFSDDELLLNSLYTGLMNWNIPIAYEDLLSGYELGFCLRPAQILGGPILSGLLSGRAPMLGPTMLEARLLAAENIFKRIERGARRI